ncbi:MAG TPA: MBOAT family O-acyltransferase [Catalimonadaceae bacterium]|nr:MBOAT family O-acyltransferase [Catalimonadaceae bacterium]
MLFNSIQFALFLPVVYILYWYATAGKVKIQNILLLIASYYFYACWDYRFLFLLIFSTFLDYYTGLKMANAVSGGIRKFWFWLSVGINLGFLGTFKYYNFFASSFAEAVSGIGFDVHPSSLQVILPVGISFYTFHGLSYVIDIYKGRIPPEKSFVDYAVFVSFFPLLVAGPIERATHLLPQIKSERVFNYNKSVDGLRQILWGLFKKIVIADNCAAFANAAFAEPGSSSSAVLTMGAIFFAFQIYGDFSGYSDIALGTARLFGVELLRNFAFPYFSRDIAEFWRRWHISLSSWFRDYLYIPLGGSKGGNWSRVRNTFIIFIVSGFWHGANWTFIMWGFLNALFIMPSILFQTNRANLDIVAAGRLFPTFKEAFSVVLTFSLTVFAWIFFRADSVSDALAYISGMLAHPGSFLVLSQFEPYFTIIPILLIFLVVEWLGRENQFAISRMGLQWKKPFRYAFYYSIVFAIFWFGGKEQQFIYFQF